MHSDASKSSFAPALWRFIRRRLPWWVSVSTLGMLTPPLTQALSKDAVGRFAWLADLAAHWQWLFLAGFALGLVAACFVARRYLFLALLLPLPWVTASPRLPGGTNGVTLTVASANVHVSTTQVGPLAGWLALEDPEVVVLLEVSRALGPQLVSLQRYPHQVVHADDSPFGIAVLSKWPLTNAAVKHDSDGIRHIEADVLQGEQRIQLLAFHPMPPLSSHFHAARNQALQRFATQLQASGRPALLVGDLNATPWSSAFAGLEALGFRRATGLRPTWPTGGQGLWGIPIDHVLASKHWHLVQHHLGPDLGSDHLPTVVRLALTPTLTKQAALISPPLPPVASTP
jgi:endonuclease/exonuclease/phosphatase (EEP) superfamily protein YafD